TAALAPPSSASRRWLSRTWRPRSAESSAWGGMVTSSPSRSGHPARSGRRASSRVGPSRRGGGSGGPGEGRRPGGAARPEPGEQAQEAAEEGAVEVLAGGEVDVEGRATRLVEDPEREGAQGRALAHGAAAGDADVVAPAGAADGEGRRGGHRSLLSACVDGPR